MRFQIGGEYLMTVDQFWSTVFFDPAFNDYLHFKGLGFSSYDIVEDRVEKDGQRFRLMRAHPQTSIPKPLQRLLGDSFSYVENGRFNPVEKTWMTHIELPKLGQKLNIESTMSFAAKTDKTSERTVNFEIHANIFGLGRILEKFTEAALRDSYERARIATNAWFLEQQGSPSAV